MVVVEEEVQNHLDYPSLQGLLLAGLGFGLNQAALTVNHVSKLKWGLWAFLAMEAVPRLGDFPNLIGLQKRQVQDFYVLVC